MCAKLKVLVPRLFSMFFAPDWLSCALWQISCMCPFGEVLFVRFEAKWTDQSNSWLSFESRFIKAMGTVKE